MNVDKVVLVTDLTGRERHAYRTAAALARQFGALLQLVHVVEQGGRCLRRAEEQLTEAANAEEEFLAVRIQTIALGGSDPHGRLADFAEREDAKLILCTRSRAETGGFRVERILPERLATECAAPLLVLPSDSELGAANKVDRRRTHRVLVPHDLCEATHPCADIVQFLLQESRAVSFFYFLHPEFISLESDAELAEEERKRRMLARDHLESFLSTSRAETDHTHILLGSGPTGLEVVKKARAFNVDLIVVPNRGSHGHGRWFSPDDLSWILRHAPCSVLSLKMPVAETTCGPGRQGYEFYCG